MYLAIGIRVKLLPTKVQKKNGNSGAGPSKSGAAHRKSSFPQGNSINQGLVYIIQSLVYVIQTLVYIIQTLN